MRSSTESSRCPRHTNDSLVQGKIQPSRKNGGDMGTTSYCKGFTRGPGGDQAGTEGDTHQQQVYSGRSRAITPCTREVVFPLLWAVQAAAVAEGWRS